jgi:hypothetical protein
MRDFDAERHERLRHKKPVEFKLGGEKFKMRQSVSPDVIAEADELSGETGPKQTLENIDTIMLELIDPVGGAHAKYRKVREQRDDAVGLIDLIEAMWWLIGENTARPTVPPSPSTTGRRRTSTRSTAGSASKARA